MKLNWGCSNRVFREQYKLFLDNISKVKTYSLEGEQLQVDLRINEIGGDDTAIQVAKVPNHRHINLIRDGFDLGVVPTGGQTSIWDLNYSPYSLEEAFKNGDKDAAREMITIAAANNDLRLWLKAKAALQNVRMSHYQGDLEEIIESEVENEVDTDYEIEDEESYEDVDLSGNLNIRNFLEGLFGLLCAVVAMVLAYIGFLLLIIFLISLFKAF